MTDAAKGGKKAAKPRRRRRPLWLRLGFIALMLLVVAPVAAVATLRVVPVPITWLMVERLAQGQGLEKRWTPLSRIASSLPTAVIAAEDARFCSHHGFDFEAMEAAARANAKTTRNGGGKVRGGSTISQQTAKNVFLWPHRDYARKGLEAGFTVLIEALWGKRRIMEVYLNVVEWGPGLYGAQAAARRYFHEDASALTPAQSARLAAILPSPLKWRAVAPGRYVARRTRLIGANAAVVREDDLAACVH